MNVLRLISQLIGIETLRLTIPIIPNDHEEQTIHGERRTLNQ